MRAFCISLAIGLLQAAAQPGYHLQGSGTHSEEPNHVALSPSDTHRLPGCGAGKGGADVYDQTTCGNYAGAPYEDLSTASPNTPPSPVGWGKLHLISSCTTLSAVTTGDVWRFASDINDGAGGTNQNCIHFPGLGSGNFVLDLAGHTLTGGIHFDQSQGGHGPSGLTVVNGRITCNIATGGAAACIDIYAMNIVTSMMFSHLTVHNINSPSNPDNVASGRCNGVSGKGFCGFEFAVYVEVNNATINTCPAGTDQKNFSGACVEVAHLDAANAFGYTGEGYTTGWCGRCTDLYIVASGGMTAEVWNSQSSGCGGYVDACQGFVFMAVGSKKAHHNRVNWNQYKGTGDTGRSFLLDSAGGAFNTHGGDVFSNEILAYNNRALRTRQESNISIHDNRIEHVQGRSTIMMGENDDYAEQITNMVNSNTFLMEGGTGIVVGSAYGPIFDSNTFTCISSCPTSTVARTDVQNLVFNIISGSRTPSCVVTLNLASAPSTTSKLGGLFVNVSGTGTDFDTAGTAGNVVKTRVGATFTYMQRGCSGAASIGTGGQFWMAQNLNDNFAANGAEFYIRKSIIDPLLTNPSLIVACGQHGHPNACLSGNPQTTLNGGQTQIRYCDNIRNTIPLAPVAGTGAVVSPMCGKLSLP